MTYPYLLLFSHHGLFILRLVVGIVFIYHSFPKLKDPKIMAQGLKWPVAGPFILGLVELLAGFSLVVGFFTQIAALLLALVMVGALWHKLVKWHVPFMAFDKIGWEFDLTLLAANIAIITTGGGSIGIL